MFMVYVSVNTIFEYCYKLTSDTSSLKAQDKVLCKRDERKICYIYQRKMQISPKSLGREGEVTFLSLLSKLMFTNSVVAMK